MKKFKALSLILALLIALTVAPTTLASESEYPIFDALGFKFEIDETKEITRFDLAKIAIEIAKLEVTSEGTSAYVDVPAVHWAFPEINTVTKYGYMSGLTNKTFAPDAKASVADAAQVLMNLLGYGNFGKQANWATADYLMKARGIGLLSGVSISNGKLDAAALKKMISNMFYENVVTVASVGTDGVHYVVDEEMTYLQSAYGYYLKEGLMQAAGKSSVSGSNPVALGKIKVNGVTYDANGKDYSEFLGYEVRVIVDENDENANVIFVEKLKDYSENEIFMKASEIEDYSSYTYYYRDEDQTIEQASISISSQIFLNGQKITYNEMLMEPLSGSVKLLDTDGDDIYDIVYITYELFYEVAGAFKDEYIADAIGGNELRIKNKEFLIYENGAVAGMNEIENEKIVAVMPGAVKFESGSTYPYADNDNLTRATVETNIEMVAGTVGGKSSTSCIVNGTEYEYSKYFEMLVANGKCAIPGLNKYVVIYLNSEGQVVYSKVDIDAMLANRTEKYGYLIKANAARGENNKIVVKIFTEDAQFIDGETPEKIKINGERKYAKDIFNNTTLFPAQDRVLDTQLITYEVDEAGSVIAINTVTDYTSTTPYEGYDLENFSKEFIGSIKYYYTFRHLYTIDANTMLFEIPEDLDDVKAYKITKGEKVLANNKTYYVEFYDTDEQYNIAAIVMDYNRMAELGTSSENKTLTYSHSSGEINSFVVCDKNTVMNEDGEEVVELKGLTYSGTPGKAGKMDFRYLAATSNDLKDTDTGSFGHIYSKYLNTKWGDLDIGDVIHYRINEEGYVDLFRLVFKQEDMRDAGTGNVVYTVKGQPTSAAYLVSGVIHKVFADGNFLFRSAEEKTITSIHKARPVTSQMSNVKVFIFENNSVREADVSELRPEDAAMFICEYGRLYEAIVYR